MGVLESLGDGLEVALEEGSVPSLGLLDEVGLLLSEGALVEVELSSVGVAPADSVGEGLTDAVSVGVGESVPWSAWTIARIWSS